MFASQFATEAKTEVTKNANAYKSLFCMHCQEYLYCKWFKKSSYGNS